MRTVCMVNYIDTVWATDIRSPPRSNLVTFVFTVKSSSVCIILIQIFHYHPYKLQIIQELKPNDHLMWKSFCERMHEKIHKYNECVKSVWMSGCGFVWLNLLWLNFSLAISFCDRILLRPNLLWPNSSLTENMS